MAGVGCAALVHIAPHGDPRKSGLVPDHVDDLPVRPSMQPLVHWGAIIDPAADAGKVSDGDFPDAALGALVDEMQADDVEQMLHLPAFPAGDLAIAPRAAFEFRSNLLPVPADRFDEPA